MRSLQARSRIVIPGLLSGALWGLAAAGEKPLDLRLAPPAGKVLRYRIDNQIDVNNQGIEVTTMVSGHVTLTRAQDANGNLVFDVVVERLEASRLQGDDLEPQDLGLDGAKLVAEVTPRGSLVEIEPVSTMNEQQRKLGENLVHALFLQLPAQPVQRGDTWKADMSKPDGSRQGTGEFTVDDVAKKGDGTLAKISGPVTVVSMAPPYQGKGTFEARLAVPGGYIVTAKGSMDLESEDGPSVEQSLQLKLIE